MSEESLDWCGCVHASMPNTLRMIITASHQATMVISSVNQIAEADVSHLSTAEDEFNYLHSVTRTSKHLRGATECVYLLVHRRSYSQLIFIEVFNVTGTVTTVSECQVHACASDGDLLCLSSC